MFASGAIIYAYVNGNPVNAVDPLGLLKNDVGIGGAFPFIGGFNFGLFVTDGKGDTGCHSDAGIFLQLNKPISGGDIEEGFGKLKLGPSIGFSTGGRGKAIQTGAEVFAGAGGLGVAIGSETGSPANADSITFEGGTVAALGGDQTINFSLSIGDLARLTAATVSGDFSQKIFGVGSSNQCGCNK